MIDQTDRRLIEWIQSVLPDTAVSLEPPVNDMPSGVNLYLLELGASPPPRGPERSPVQFSLYYMITSWATDVFEAHKLLGDLVAAAMLEAEFEVSFEVSRINWQLFGLMPRPSFILKVAARVPLPEPAVPLVRKPMVLQMETITSLAGRVVGPGDVPIAGADVHLAALGLTVRTDGDGRFVVPVGSRPPVLRVTAKGWSRSLVAEPPADGKPLVVRLDPTEV